MRIEPMHYGVRESDQIIAAVAATNDGHYDIDAHLQFDPTATEAFAQAHVRRLEAIRRLTRGVEREPDGSWIIAPDHLERAAAYEAARARDRPVALTTLATQPLGTLVDVEAATWLDRELVAPSPEPLREAGFGRDVREAQARRRQWLIGQGLAAESDGMIVYRADMIGELQRRELVRVAKRLSQEVGRPFLETAYGEEVQGIYRRPVDLVSGRFAIVEKSREFRLVPWAPVLERHVGRTVSGIMRGDSINWTLGRQRSGPSIS